MLPIKGTHTITQADIDAGKGVIVQIHQNPQGTKEHRYSTAIGNNTPTETSVQQNIKHCFGKTEQLYQEVGY
jgi:hypothetical protein